MNKLIASDDRTEKDVTTRERNVIQDCMSCK